MGFRADQTFWLEPNSELQFCVYEKGTTFSPGRVVWELNKDPALSPTPGKQQLLNNAHSFLLTK